MLGALPRIEGQTVLDLGCGVGDLAAELASRGARVIGVDASEELLVTARARQIPNAEFLCADLRNLPDLGIVADGVWSSFAAAYFIDLSGVLSSWSAYIRPGGWMALTEIDDFFGHEPLRARTRSLHDAYAQDALAAERYDFQMGRRLREHLERSGLTVAKELSPGDRELAFDGAAAPEVVEAWRARLDGMTLLRTFCGEEWNAVREDFLGCLSRADHRAAARVCFALATKPLLSAATGPEAQER